MILQSTTPAIKFEIRQPRWKDRTVLLAKYKIGTHNVIVFTNAPTYQGEFYISGENARRYPVNSNGKIDCYCIPVNDLERLERA